MPSNPEVMVAERRYVWVEDRQGTRLPFSKGILANSLMVARLDPEAAYRTAETVEDHLFASGRQVVGVEELTATVERVLAGLEPGAGATWSAWVGARRAGHPVVVLIGGGTGAGKSTVATRLGTRLGITRVIATDAVREVMRGSLPETMLPVLHVSSFEAHLAVKNTIPDDQDQVVAGFRQQVELVVSGVRRLVDRAIREATDLILEGVHLVPGLLGEELTRWERKAAVTQMVLSIPDPEQHRAHFLTRLEHSQGRRPGRYLQNLEEIRLIQRYILLQAKAHGVPELEVRELDEAVETAAAMTVQRVISWTGNRLRQVGS